MGRPRAITTGRDSEQVTIRLPLGMRDEINRIAAQNGRSANAEIVSRLERSLSTTDSPDFVAMRECFKGELSKVVDLILNKK